MLGLIDPDKYLGGRMKLDADLAREAVGRLADRLGLGLMEAAAGISTVVDAKMADLVRRMSLLRGLDPRRFACAAFGGGGPLHSPAVAAQAGIRTLIVPLPRAASVWSAFGAATSDVAHIFQRWTVLNLPVSGADVEAIFGELEALAGTTLDSQGVALDNVSLVRSVRMRYSMQIHDVEVPVSAGTIDDAAVEELDVTFERIHDELFGKGSGFRAGGVEFTAFQVRATAHTTKPSLAGAMHEEPAKSSRSIYWPELREAVETATFDAVPGDAVRGPALIELRGHRDRDPARPQRAAGCARQLHRHVARGQGAGVSGRRRRGYVRLSRHGARRALRPHRSRRVARTTLDDRAAHPRTLEPWPRSVSRRSSPPSRAPARCSTPAAAARD